jgi:hypothetical protein
VLRDPCLEFGNSHRFSRYADYRFGLKKSVAVPNCILPDAISIPSGASAAYPMLFPRIVRMVQYLSSASF